MTTVGFAISVDAAWLGGINYYRNLITALYEDPDRSIDVVLMTGLDAGKDNFKGFPKLKIIRSAVFDRKSLLGLARRLVKRITGQDYVIDWWLAWRGIDVLSHSIALWKNARTPVISWIPDFQHLHLPALFSPQEVEERNRWFQLLCEGSVVVVLSSESARGDLVELFPWAADKSEVLRFVPDIEALDKIPALAEIEQRHGFSGPYMYLPNQYWAHKNHALVVEALALLKQAGRQVKVISTGSPVDLRHPEFYSNFCERVKTLGVGGSYLQLGVVPYLDLLALMRHAVCVINPSLFEGWSSTVEESKALSKHILLSNISVHREQNPASSDYFAVDDVGALVEIIWRRWQEYAGASNGIDEARVTQEHRQRRLAFSRKYHRIVDRAVRRARPESTNA